MAIRRLVQFLFLTCVFTAGAPGLDSTAAAAPAATKNVPTTIKSGKMEYDANTQIVVFLGNVYVKRPDFELWADKMTVYLDKSKQADQTGGGLGGQGMEAGDIDRIVAEKNVRLKSEERHGSCNKATYYAKEDKFVMEGNPLLWDNKKSTISGGTIVHFLSTNKSEVQNSAGITFYAPDKTENGSKGPRP